MATKVTAGGFARSLGLSGKWAIMHYERRNCEGHDWHASHYCKQNRRGHWFHARTLPLLLIEIGPHGAIQQDMFK